MKQRKEGKTWTPEPRQFLQNIFQEFFPIHIVHGCLQQFLQSLLENFRKSLSNAFCIHTPIEGNTNVVLLANEFHDTVHVFLSHIFLSQTKAGGNRGRQRINGNNLNEANVGRGQSRNVDARFHQFMGKEASGMNSQQ